MVNLPDNRNIVVDSKLPLDAFMEALETPGEERKSDLIKKHAKDLRGHMNQLSKKEYWRISKRMRTLSSSILRLNQRLQPPLTWIQVD